MAKRCPHSQAIACNEHLQAAKRHQAISRTRCEQLFQLFKRHTPHTDELTVLSIPGKGRGAGAGSWIGSAQPVNTVGEGNHACGHAPLLRGRGMTLRDAHLQALLTCRYRVGGGRAMGERSRFRARTSRHCFGEAFSSASRSQDIHH
jgi:hypothetical protein